MKKLLYILPLIAAYGMHASQASAGIQIKTQNEKTWADKTKDNILKANIQAIENTKDFKTAKDNIRLNYAQFEAIDRDKNIFTTPLDTFLWRKSVDKLAELIKKAAGSDKDLLAPLAIATSANDEIINTLQTLRNSVIYKLSKKIAEKIQLEDATIKRILADERGTRHFIKQARPNASEKEIDDLYKRAQPQIKAYASKAAIASILSDSDKELITKLKSKLTEEYKKKLSPALSNLEKTRFFYSSKKEAKDALIDLIKKIENLNIRIKMTLIDIA